MIWGESISGGRGEARRVGRRDCSTRNAVAKSNVSSRTTQKEVLSEKYSCPASKSARLMVRLQTWHQIVEGADLSW